MIEGQDLVLNVIGLIIVSTSLQNRFASSVEVSNEIWREQIVWMPECAHGFKKKVAGKRIDRLLASFHWPKTDHTSLTSLFTIRNKSHKLDCLPVEESSIVLWTD